MGRRSEEHHRECWRVLSRSRKEPFLSQAGRHCVRGEIGTWYLRPQTYRSSSPRRLMADMEEEALILSQNFRTEKNWVTLLCHYSLTGGLGIRALKALKRK